MLGAAGLSGGAIVVGVLALAALAAALYKAV
jgi:hypothetical protein